MAFGGSGHCCYSVADAVATVADAVATVVVQVHPGGRQEATVTKVWDGTSPGDEGDENGGASVVNVVVVVEGPSCSPCAVSLVPGSCSRTETRSCRPGHGSGRSLAPVTFRPSDRSCWDS